MADIEVISAGHGVCGEGPHWDAASQSLYSISVSGGDHKSPDVLRWDERRRAETGLLITPDPAPAHPLAEFTTFVIPVRGRADTFVVSRGDRLATLRWDGVSPQHELRCFARVDEHVPHPMRLNDGKCDPLGRLWTGTMSEESSPGEPRVGAGSLYSVARDGGVTARQDGISISNGLGWSADMTHLFYNDSYTRKVEVFDHDPASGAISGRRTVLDAAAARLPGLPDGLTVDSRGRLWVALFGGARVVCVDPAQGRVAETIHLPTYNITSCTFGGAGLDALYVTSATFGLQPFQRKIQPDAGAIFRVTGLGVTGTPNRDWDPDWQAVESRRL